ncbi:hypothetical protein N8I77_002559 [Diaporthe amygdali]|uniref:Uncharacterized protein n=1 Tax=Phomopsis amygdali TaxID=1214568 RepID=A0AAD9SR54_PHOAM|nr:hypothetical protein N8I77_002559 [Diaporthe amygdali]
MTAMVHTLSSLPKSTEVILALNDSPNNDFNTLAATVERDRGQLSREGDLEIFKLMLPASFYGPVLPGPLKADIGLSLSSLHYLEHELPPLDELPADAVQWENLTREAAKVFSVAEMVKFLRLRSDEIRSPGGTLILAFPCQSEDDRRVWWGLGLAMRAAFMSAVSDGLLEKDVVLRHGNSMGTRTVEQVYEALDQVKDVWSTEHVFVRDIVHPDYSTYSESCAGAGQDEKREAYVKFARTLVEMTYAVYTPFLLQAIRKTKRTGVANNVGAGPSESEEEKGIIEDLKRKSLDYYCEREMGSPFWIPYIYVKLDRK